MRNVILQEFVTLDGLVSGPNGEVEFIPASTGGDPSFGREQLELMRSVDAILLGRKTYQMFAGYWPNVTEGDERVFAEMINATPKFVFTRSLERAPWGNWNDATILKGDVGEEVRRVKGVAGKNILIWGSISLAQPLIREGLIDEYRPVLCPVTLGSGRPLFPAGIASKRLRLVSATALDQGALALRYAAGP